MALKAEDCIKCPCIGSFAKHSNWEYCTDPDNFRNFKIIRWRSDFGGGCTIKPPTWCVKKKL